LQQGKRRWTAAFAAVALAVGVWLGGGAPQAVGAEKIALQSKRDYCFESAGVTFSNRFSGARLSDSVEIGPGEFRLVIRPENTPINDSAWYAFQVTSGRAQTVRVRLTYENGKHRYRPKISCDGRHWKPLPPETCKPGADKREAVLELHVGPEPLWVAGQEMLGVEELNAWADRMAQLPFAERSLLGRSAEGRPIRELVLTEAEEPDHVVIIGRQHPPEVTGSLGLMAFVETLARNDGLARRFRRAFQVTVVCLVNPDGVERGHWRHNVHGVDLNRDWGSFAQPETRVIRDEILRLDASPGRLSLFVDFHSTHHDVFYTQKDDQETFPEDFTPRWLAALRDRVPGHSVRGVASSGSKPTSQRWAYQTFGVASVTYEVGDNTDRRRIRRVAEASAEEMMRLLLPAEARPPRGQEKMVGMRGIRFARPRRPVSQESSQREPISVGHR
jgi:hypothetical protein